MFRYDLAVKLIYILSYYGNNVLAVRI